MRTRVAVFHVSLVILLGALRPALAQDTRPSQETAARPRAAMSVWDTGTASAKTLDTAALVARTGWKQVDPSETAASFKGDAVVSNGRVLVVVRAKAMEADVYSLASATPTAQLRFQLLAEGGNRVERLDRIALVENVRAAACLEVAGKTAAGAAASARLRLKRGEIALQVEPRAGAAWLRVECPSRFVVLPDFFADDLLIDARTIRPDRVELPSENFLLNLAGQGDSLTMSVFENRRQDAVVRLSGQGEERVVAVSEIPFEGKKVWIATLDGPGLWHATALEEPDAGKIVPLKWSMPFAGQWRVDFTKTDGLTDSWEMLLPAEKGGGYLKPSWLGAGAEPLPESRKKWNTVLGTYPYPCWSDPKGNAFVQPIKSRALKFRGTAVVYPINRVKATPLDVFTVVDVMRNTLGVGPCEYILDLEGQKSEYKGRATCSVRDSLQPIYTAKQQKQKRARDQPHSRRRPGVRDSHSRPDHALRRVRAHHPRLSGGPGKSPSRARGEPLGVGQVGRRDRRSGGRPRRQDPDARPCRRDERAVPKERARR